jgi:hypothetical protein
VPALPVQNLIAWSEFGSPALLAQWPVLSEAAHHIGDITAPPWHRSVTESFALPPD